MRLFLPLCISLVSFFLPSTASATDYTFTGSGSWVDSNNWLNGLMPPSGLPLPAGSTITIQGTTSTASTCIFPCTPVNYFGSLNGTLIIALGGSLTLQNGTQFSNGGSLIVYGTLINKTTYEGFSTGTLTIYGSVINQSAGFGFQNLFGNQGLITINGGGILRNEFGLLDNDMDAAKGTIVLNSGGTIQNIAPARIRLGRVINNGGIISNAANLAGNATITGDLRNSGTLAPGNSPGSYTVSGNYTASGSAIHNFEVGGTASNAYDRLLVGGMVNLNGALNISLINGYLPSATTAVTIITGTINGTFSSVTIPNSLMVVYNSNSVQLKSSATLPVTFVRLYTEKEGSGTKLTWMVQSEDNVVRYEVERSKDGRIFTKAGTVAAGSRNQYDFSDAAAQGRTFYRIKSIDRDGTYKYSAVVSFDQDKTAVALLVYPVPARSSITLQHATAAKDSKITLSSMEGKALMILFPMEGVQQTEINTGSLPAGTYMIRFSNAGEEETRKFIKQ